MQVRPTFFVSSVFRPGGRNFKGRRLLAFLQAERKLKPLSCLFSSCRCQFQLSQSDSEAKASHDSRQQLDRYAFIFSIFYMFVFSYICNVCFCVIIIPILYNYQQNLHLNQPQKFNIGAFPRFLGTKNCRLNIPFSKDILINA